MRSGFDKYDGIWGNPFYDDVFRGIADLDFTQSVFVERDALVSPGGNQTLYEGQPFDPTKVTLQKGVWDHEHCLVCRCQIVVKNTFWQNRKGEILCDACHDHYLAGS